MKPAHPRIAEGQRDRQPRAQIFGKAGVVGGREGQLAPQALPARGHAEGAFGGDVDVVRADLLEDLGDLPAGAQREPDLRIGRARYGPEPVGRDHLDDVTERLALGLELL